MGTRDVESSLGRRGEAKSGEFEKMRAYGARPVL